MRTAPIKLIGELLLPLLVFQLTQTATGIAVSPRLSLEGLVREADLIIAGRVLSVKSEASANHSVITTIVVLSVDDQWKGPKLSVVTLKQPGGSAKEITQRVTGFPRFSTEEEVLLFLKSEGGYHTLLGGKQGKFAIKTDPRSGKKSIEDLTGQREDHESFIRRLKEMLGN